MLWAQHRETVFTARPLHAVLGISPQEYLARVEAIRVEDAYHSLSYVRSVLGHWLFGFVHPYMDGNGRMARFTMNLMLASGGYPWTVIRVEDRAAYMAALEKASVEDDLGTFSAFVARCVDASR